MSSKQAKGKLQPNQKINVTAYPNPSTGVVHFDFEEDNTYIYTITNVLGNVLKTGAISPSANEIDLQDLTAGVYFLNINSSNYKQTERIILQ